MTETALHLPRLRPVIKNTLKQVVEIRPLGAEFFLEVWCSIIVSIIPYESSQQILICPKDTEKPSGHTASHSCDWDLCAV